MHDAMHAVYVHACEEQYVVLPYFCWPHPEIWCTQVHIYIHIQTQLKLNVLTFEKKYLSIQNNEDKGIKWKKLKKTYYIREKNSRQNLFILTTAGDSWRLQAAPGAACNSWRLLATPGVVCILVVPVVPNKKIKIHFISSLTCKTYKIYCKELVQATCKITSKITM